MKSWLFILSLYVLTSCSCEQEQEPKYEMMTRYGGWEARKDEIKADVDKLRGSLDQYIRYDFDSVDYTVFQSPFPYWERIEVYLDEEAGLKAAYLFPQTAHEQLHEELYFNEGQLEYALCSHPDLKEDTTQRAYFFIENQLVHCYNNNGLQLPLDDTSVKLASVDLIHEANQIRTIISQKEIKP